MQIAQSRKLSLALLTGGAIATAIILLDIADRMELMRPGGQTASALAAQPIGAKVKAIVELERDPVDGAFSGTVLEDAGASQFHRTAKVLRIVVGATAHFVMGSQSDLHSGTVVEVSGATVSPATVDASQIVVLTGYVMVRH